MAANALLSLPPVANSIARDSRKNKKSKWDKMIDGKEVCARPFLFFNWEWSEVHLQVYVRKLSGNPDSAKPLLQHLKAPNYEGEDLMINETLDIVEKLQNALIKAEAFVSNLPKDAPYQNFEKSLKKWGFQKGWGDTAERVRETMRTVSKVLEAPDPAKLESIFNRLPGIFNIVIFSPHGYFGQSDVLGLPDTGGQVVYILDQVRALEEELILRIKQQGLILKPQILVVNYKLGGHFPKNYGLEMND
ncbi:hypothetical protein FNV43_RR10449 [Rhamnella rubrinervis]|uniref:sucrose synthase n=1 Tax=Rhamnella rubrinervis TaxID=2594499 RepID=A0A8K0HCP2_9ROSA|nr:hypothetical protein FNV43_RR10449 [Rhamnella rubrinervis]